MHAFQMNEKVKESQSIFMEALIKEVSVLRAENEILRRENTELKHELVIDPLTQAYNRRKLEEKEDTFTIVIDCVKFKQVNDTYGHDIGDLVLIEVAEQLKHHMRDEDVIRLGGDEFVIILEDVSSKEEAEGVFKRLENDLPFVQVKNRTNEYIRVGLSIGFADNFKSADDNMYQNKRTSNNIAQKMKKKQKEKYDNIREVV